MAPVLLDTSIYITALRSGSDVVLTLRRLTQTGPVWLSSVVLAELYAGAKMQDWRIIERLERDFDRAKRILVPNLTDWTTAGRLLAQVAATYDYEKRGVARLSNDALIAMSAARRAIVVVTANERDFARLARLRPFQWQIGLSF